MPRTSKSMSSNPALYAFDAEQRADSLEYIICRAEEVPYTYVNTFRNVGTYYGWQTKVYVPAGSLEAYKNSFWVDKVSRPTEDGGTETNGGGFQRDNFIAYYNMKVENGTAQSSIAADAAPEADVVTLTAAEIFSAVLAIRV